MLGLLYRCQVRLSLPLPGPLGPYDLLRAAGYQAVLFQPNLGLPELPPFTLITPFPPLTPHPSLTIQTQITPQTQLQSLPHLWQDGCQKRPHFQVRQVHFLLPSEVHWLW